MKSNRLISICGYRNSGKDVSAEMLQYLLNAPTFLHSYKLYTKLKSWFKNGDYQITSFAKPLKRTLAAMLNIPIEYFEDRNFKENYYIKFPEAKITPNPNKELILSDNKFSKLIAKQDFSFLTENYITIRQLLQVFGTEIAQTFFGKYIWVYLTLNNIKPTIISDLRFKTEMQAIKNSGGIVIYINNPKCKPGNHASERQIEEMYNSKEFDYIINNNGTLKDLFNSLKNICKSM